MASSETLRVHETYPYYHVSPQSLISLSAFDPADNFDTLTRSMRDLTSYADLLSRVLAQQSQASQQADQKAAPKKVAAKPADPHLLELPLRPLIHWRETADGFVLTAVTPGLRKDQLSVELLDASGEAFIEIARKDPPAHSPRDKDKDGNKAEAGTQDAKPLEVRARYGSFSERVRLPRGVDREAMRARYEDGLLVVTIPRSKPEGEKRRSIAIA